jgi:peptide/nickel transport system substrate-binding protein
MAPTSRLVILFFGLFAMMAASSAALAQKRGGILRQYIIDSPASMSIHEETTVVAERPMMGVFNNLVMFDQHVAQNSMASPPTGCGTKTAPSSPFTCAKG